MKPHHIVRNVLLMPIASMSVLMGCGKHQETRAQEKSIPVEIRAARMEENRVQALARQHGVRGKRDDGGTGKTLAAFLRRADEGTLSKLLVESIIWIAASRNNPATVLRDAAVIYKVDTDAITQKVKAEFAAKAKAKKESKANPKTVKAA